MESSSRAAADGSLSRLLLGVALVAALVSGVRAAARIGATVPGFCVTRNLRVDRVGDPWWPALRSGAVRGADRVLAIQPTAVRIALSAPEDLYRVVAAYAPGTPMTYFLERRGQAFTLTIPTARFSIGSFLALYGCSVIPALLAFMLACWTVRRQPRHPASRRFLLVTVIAYAGNLAFCEVTLYGRLDAVYTASVYLLAVAFVNFALFFPRPRALVIRRPRLVGGLFLAAAAATVTVTTLRALGHLLAPRWDSMGPLLLAGSEIFLGISMLQSYWAWDDYEARERARVALFGYGIATPMLGIAMLPGTITGATIPANLFFPITLITTGSLAYAIVRGNLFELRYVLRRRSLTVALAVLWAVVFFTLALLIDTTSARDSVTAHAALAALVVVTGFGFASTRAALERWVDHVFFRSRAAYKPTVQQLSASFTHLLRAADVLRQTHAIVSRVLPAARVQVCSDAGDAGAIPPALQSWLTRARGPISRASEPGATAALDACTAEVAAPIAFEGRLRAALLLGPKRSGELYTSEDLDLLDTIANQAAIALENAYSFEELDNLRKNLEREVNARTRELRDTQVQLVHAEKMASLGQLVAGVAHELNNPLGAVDGNLAVLQDYLGRLREALESYERAAPEHRGRFANIRRGLALDEVIVDLDHLLATCAEGSQRARRIVQDLRTFSRLDEAELKQVDLNAALRVTLDLLQHRVHGNVRIETALAPLPPVECYASQLNQVLLNLLTNALDAVESADGGVVRVSSRALPDGWIEIAVQDTGPGVPLSLRNKIFDPFFTTKPVGKGTGLGLSISYSIAAKHHGRLELDPAPPPGCTFRLMLPARPLATMPAAGAAGGL
ncbi:MAG TPA: ATP-binding protein [Candidatus Kryptonia bacterium]|nr:ATP-binding protein [Candidatus Kryptonia bacterium]